MSDVKDQEFGNLAGSSSRTGVYGYGGDSMKKEVIKPVEENIEDKEESEKPIEEQEMPDTVPEKPEESEKMEVEKSEETEKEKLDKTEKVKEKETPNKVESETKEKPTPPENGVTEDEEKEVIKGKDEDKKEAGSPVVTHKRKVEEGQGDVAEEEKSPKTAKVNTPAARIIRLMPASERKKILEMKSECCHAYIDRLSDEQQLELGAAFMKEDYSFLDKFDEKFFELMGLDPSSK